MSRRVIVFWVIQKLAVRNLWTSIYLEKWMEFSHQFFSGSFRNVFYFKTKKVSNTFRKKWLNKILCQKKADESEMKQLVEWGSYNKEKNLFQLFSMNIKCWLDWKLFMDLLLRFADNIKNIPIYSWWVNSARSVDISG